MDTTKSMFVHLINDEKFITPFMKRADDIHPDHIYVVFGDPSPFKFLEPSERVIHSSEWESYCLEHSLSIERIYVHLLTFQKIQWVKSFGQNKPLYWLFYGNDLYELLQVIHGFQLYEREDKPRGWLSTINKPTLLGRLKRWAQLKAYNRHFTPFVQQRIDYFCFWNPGDFQLLEKYIGTRAEMLRFQYGAFNRSDIDTVLELRGKHPKGSSTSILLNHSGSSSGNHNHLLHLIHSKLSNTKELEILAPLSYGDANHISKVLETGVNLFGAQFNPLMDFLKRDEYFRMITERDLVIFGHRRQEAGNSLFISFMAGAKVFLHPESVLIPFLKEKGYAFYTWNDIGSQGWHDPLTDQEKETNLQRSSIQFSEDRIKENYTRILSLEMPQS